MDRNPPPTSAMPGDDLPPWMLRGRVPGLDGLRGLSILLVLGSHLVRTGGFPWRVDPQIALLVGDLGVDVFFAISGFLITLLLWREVRRTGSISLKGFYARRALRILPAYAAYLAFLLVLSNAGVFHLSGRDWLGALTYTVNFERDPANEIGHIWSLSIEEHFYLAWPPLLVMIGLTRARSAVIGCLILEPVVRAAAVRWYGLDAPIKWWTFTRLDTIAAGCALALLATEPAFRARLRRLERRPTALFVASAAFLGATALLAFVDEEFKLLFKYSARAIAISGMLWACISRVDSLVGRLVNSRGMVLVGVLSYSLYLWQQPFLTAHRVGFAETMSTWPLNLGLAVSAAVASYLVVERPFLRFKQHLARVPAGEPAPLAVGPVA